MTSAPNSPKSHSIARLPTWQRISSALKDAAPEDAAAERKVLEAALKQPATAKPAPEEIAPGLTLEVKAGRAVLAGKALDSDFIQALRDWIATR